QAECGIKEAKVRATFKGRDFDGMKFQHPFLPIHVPGILANYVTLDQGSGIVHTAPGHGADDFYSGQKYGLEIYAPLDDKGVYLERFWGVPIIVFYCEGCGTRLEDFKALRNVVKWFEKEGADAWYQHTPEELLPAGTKCSCGSTKWRKENDILDVWFDSGSSN